MTPAELSPIFSPVPGWLSTDEGHLLYELARDWPGDGRVVELGSAQGRSAICLALGVRERGGHHAVLAVDTHRGSVEHQRWGRCFDPRTYNRAKRVVNTFPAFRQNLAERGLDPWVEPWRLSTIKAARRFDEKVRVLFIDADHRERAVRADVKNWLPHLEQGAVVVFHDVGSWSGPTNVAYELVADGRYWSPRRAESAVALTALRASAKTPAERTGGLGAFFHRACAGDPAAGASWERVLESGTWSLSNDGIHVRGDGAEWVALGCHAWRHELGPCSDVIVELTLHGEAEAAGVGFGAFKDFLAKVEHGTDRHLRLELCGHDGSFDFRVDGESVGRAWWNEKVMNARDLMLGPLTLKARHAVQVRFERLALFVRRSQRP